MRVILIAPASGRWRGIGRSRWFGGRVFRFSLLSLLRVAADTPAGIDVRIVDEQVDDVPVGERFDLAGITCMTAAAPRAYELAETLRRAGTPVVLGGIHPTLMPDEALAHADAVCVGEAEGTWRRIVEDARAGRLARRYEGAAGSLVGLPAVSRHLLDRRRYGTLQAVQATRGCPNRCSFCTVSALNRGSLRCRPVEEVAAEVAALPERFFVFVDDNLTADRDYARALFAALRPLDRLWIAQAALDLTDDADLVRRAAESGCIGLFVGLETFSAATLASMDKGFNKVDEYRDRIATLHAHGIGVEAGIVFGFDRDDPGVFRRTLRLLDDLEVDAAQVSILTPLPGTPFHEMMRPRIVDRDWSHYDFHHVVFRPWGMPADALQAGHDWVTRRFYRPWRVARRLARMARSPRGRRALPFAAAINLAYYGRTVRWNLRGADPAEAPRGLRRGAPIGAESPWRSSSRPAPRTSR